MLLLPGIFNTVDNGGGGGGVPTYTSSGTGQGASGALTVPWGTHSTDDWGIMPVTQRGNDTTFTAPSGWTPIVTVSTGSGSGDLKMTVFKRQATSGSEADVSLPDNGNHQAAQIHVVSGASSVTQLGSSSTGSGTAVTLTSGTTGGSNRLLMFISGNRVDTTSDQISSWTNGNLTNVIDRGGMQTAANAGSGFDVGTGELITAGAVGSTTATLATSSVWGGLVLEIAP